MTAAAMLLGVAALPGTSMAQNEPLCSTLNLVNPVYLSGGNATTPYVKRVAAGLAALPGDEKITVVYVDYGGCGAITEVFDDNTINNRRGRTWSWPNGVAGEAEPVETICQLPEIRAARPKTGFAISVVSHRLCSGYTPTSPIPNGVKVFIGEIGAGSLFTHPSSTESAISAEAAHFVFRFGQAANVAPWTIDNSIISRAASAAILGTTAGSIGLSPGLFLPVEAGGTRDGVSNPGSVNKVASQAATPNAAIGYSSAPTVDARRADVKTLAFKAFGQNAAYLPDSTSTAFDKLNVRTGRYDIWARTKYYARVDAGGNVADPKVAKVLNYLTASVPTPPSIDLLRQTILSGHIPPCAMYVGREGDPGSPIVPQAPAEPCHCLFEKVATGATSCVESATDVGCPANAPKSRNGFCEAY